MYPKNFAIFRFEDLIEQSTKTLTQIYQFFNLELQESTLDAWNQIVKDAEGIKNFKENMYSWKKLKAFVEIANIQRDCKDAMLHWGYTIFKNSNEMSSLHSITKLSLK